MKFVGCAVAAHAVAAWDFPLRPRECYRLCDYVRRNPCALCSLPHPTERRVVVGCEIEAAITLFLVDGGSHVNGMATTRRGTLLCAGYEGGCTIRGGDTTATLSVYKRR